MATRVYTSEDLLKMPESDCGYELEQGELVQLSPTGFEHGQLVAALIYELGSWIRQQKLPFRLAADVFVRIATGPPETVKGPDIVLLHADALQGETPKGVLEPVPTLVAEVISPEDDRAYLEHKVRLYLQRGISTVWVVDPSLREVWVHRREGGRDLVDRLRMQDCLTLDALLPGWALPVSRLFGE